MSEKVISEIAVVGIDIGKTSFHVIGLDHRGAVVLRQRWSRSQVELRFANMPPCLVGMEAWWRGDIALSAWSPRPLSNDREI
jgi:transposase